MAVETPIHAAPDIDTLQRKLAEVEDLVTPPLSEDERAKQSQASRAERRMRWYLGVTDSVLDLSNAMPEGTDDYDVRKLLEFLLELRRELDADPEVLDEHGHVELATMRAADVVRRIKGRLVLQQLDDPREAADLVFRTLGAVNAGELAALLGVSPRTIGAWRHGSTVRQNERRVVLIAQITSYLRSTMTPRGILMWFDAERDQLDGQSPKQVIDAKGAATAYEQLLGLARGARAQLAG